jgi:hypothetical protein
LIANVSVRCMIGTEGMTTYQLSDEVIETAGSCEQVPTILNASYCFTCWRGDEMETNEGSTLTPFDTSITRSGLRSCEQPEINAKVADFDALGVVSNEVAVSDQPFEEVSDDELEAAADISKSALNTLGLTLMAAPPCC